MCAALEIWRPIPGYDGLFEASDWGRISQGDRLLPQKLDQGGYPYVSLWLPSLGRSKRLTVHRLVTLAFYGPLPEGLVRRHLDGDRLNSRLSNLRYGTPAENNQDMVEHGTHVNTAKTHCKNNHPFDEANTYRARGRRECRACRAEAERRRYHRLRAAS